MVARMKQYRVLHYPQVPSDPFITEVNTLEEARFLCSALARYDTFLHFEEIKLIDDVNATILQCYNNDKQEWEQWMDEATGIYDVEEYFKRKERRLIK